MKIKCPICGDYLDNINQLEEHLGASVYNKKFLIRAYIDILRKIHEKIKCLQNEIKSDHFTECDSGHDFETHQNIEFAIEELKSLLENEK